MNDQDLINNQEDLLKEVRLIMPIKTDLFLFMLAEPGHPHYTQGPIVETDDNFRLVIRAITFHKPYKGGEEDPIKDMREQQVDLISKKALPIKPARLLNYLNALSDYIKSQTFDAIEKYHPHVFFFSELLNNSDLFSRSDFLSNMTNPLVHSLFFKPKK